MKDTKDNQDTHLNDDDQPIEADEVVKGKKEKHIDDYKDKYLRALADYQNLLNRTKKERSEFLEYATEQLIDELMPVLDDLELAAQSLKDRGIELIYSKLWKVLEREGLERIQITEKSEFDPATMECIDAADGGKKLQEVRAGYTMKGKVIRPAQVKVIK